MDIRSRKMLFFKTMKVTLSRRIMVETHAQATIEILTSDVFSERHDI